MTSTFMWADLSTYDIQAARHFYNLCFNWEYAEVDSGYLSCSAAAQPTAGLFTMPELFQNIGMPSFWMSYVHVPDLAHTVRVAEAHGAKVEIKSQPAPGGGTIALIRDPAGAGLTCYEGERLGGRDEFGGNGRQVWNELHVSDIQLIESFYTSVFGWQIKPSDTTDRYEIFASAGSPYPFAGVSVTDNSIKGDKEYWGVYFAVENLLDTSRLIQQHSGRAVVDQPLGKRPALLAYDPQGAAFYIVESHSSDSHTVAALTDKSAAVESEAGKKAAMGSPALKSAALKNAEDSVATPHREAPAARTRWRAITGLIMVVLAVLTEANWIWGLLFLVWIIPDIKHGATHFLEPVERRDNPVVYWLIVTTWLALSIYLLVENVYRM